VDEDAALVEQLLLRLGWLAASVKQLFAAGDPWAEDELLEGGKPVDGSGIGAAEVNL
jgi:hypothetical protein